MALRKSSRIFIVKTWQVCQYVVFVLCLCLAKFTKYSNIILFNLVKNGGRLIQGNSKTGYLFTTKWGVTYTQQKCVCTCVCGYLTSDFT